MNPSKVEDSNRLLAAAFTEGFRTLAQISNDLVQDKIRSFEFANLTTATVPKKKKGAKAPALSNVYGHSKPGEMLAVLGPSTEVQTLLLHLLAGKRHAVRKLSSGTFTTDEGQDLFDVVRPGYVQPSPVHLKTSTVREEFEFASALRTPRNVSAKLRQDLIRDLITSLDLESQANAQVKSLSEAEMKRLAIGVELLSLPNLMLVDQPLVGDRRKDWETMEILQTLAKLGVCQIVVAIASPLPEIFKLVSEHFLLVSEVGTTMSVGNAKDAVQYVASTGRVNHERFGDGDFLLLCSEFAKETWPSAHGDVEAKPGKLKHARIPQPLASSGTQFAWLLRRELRYVQREYRWLLFRFCVVVALVGIICIMFADGARQVGLRPYNIGSDLGSFIFPILIACFSTAMPLAIILFGFKQVVLREQSGATYWLGWAFASKMVTELVINFTLLAMLVGMCHQVIGWSAGYVPLLIGFFVVAESCCSYAYFFALSLNNLGGALGLLMFALGPQLLFLGAMARFSLMPPWLAWINYVCNITWGFKILISTEMDPALCTSPLICYMWKVFKESDWMDTDHIWQYYLILAAFFVFYRMLGLVNFYRAVERSC
ncbi:hypothetical protein BASA81_002738 [Batrachochytrium salamandrivorans]|nr:hypothetical protein BASA81_002738 [Batrachochytrium salamandrivorans]